MSQLKTRKFKVLGTTLPLVLTIPVVLSACSSSTSTPSPNSTTAPATSAQATPKAAEPAKEFVNLNWYMQSPINSETDQEAVEAVANKMLKESINASLHFNFIDNASWEQKMSLMNSTGTKYDIAFSTSGSNKFMNNVKMGSILPLNDLLDKYGPDIKKKVDPRAWEAVTFDGKIYAIPGQTPYSDAHSWVFKKDIAEKYKFDTTKVTTLKSIEPYLEIIKKNEPSMTPLLVTGKVAAIGTSLYHYNNLGNNVFYDERSGKLVNPLEAEDNVDVYRTMNDFYKKGYVAKDAAIKTDFIAEAKSGKYAVLEDSGGYTADGSKSTALFGYPTLETKYGQTLITTGAITSAMAVISKTSEHPDRAIMLLNEIWKNPTLSNTLAYGVEGKNYTVKSGAGTPQVSITAKSGAEQTWAIWHNWLGPLWDQWDSNWNSTAALKVMQDNNKNATASKIVGFTFNPDPVKAEIAQISAIAKEVNPVLITGSMNDFDAFLAQAKKKYVDAGYDKVMVEMQKQLDEWKTINKK
ncbi:hypothetical protein PAECIP111891_00175 [Paenibacillus allorhizoplanae]|uniref:DUF3502 domain-containing protein n=1 Tax=Paenibacillus allorhizoplanae TaxID=2905648 RepID=A0ABM9BSJ1_9BACL|nr:DUF3502 domain-containing protein [Paenibacillus allorhizoplanae]CAH1192021.1 hypothetical protein PAECIP111891_00175 [Paenibacillus allorhizoplanae]